MNALGVPHGKGYWEKHQASPNHNTATNKNSNKTKNKNNNSSNNTATTTNNSKNVVIESYAGEWVNGEKDGVGMWERDGDVYAGQYSNDFRHGKGVYRYKQGNW